MIRLTLFWFLLTIASVGFVYFVDKVNKKEVGRWTYRFFSLGVFWALFFGLIIFLERI